MRAKNRKPSSMSKNATLRQLKARNDRQMKRLQQKTSWVINNKYLIHTMLYEMEHFQV